MNFTMKQRFDQRLAYLLSVLTFSH